MIFRLSCARTADRVDDAEGRERGAVCAEEQLLRHQQQDVVAGEGERSYRERRVFALRAGRNAQGPQRRHVPQAILEEQPRCQPGEGGLGLVLTFILSAGALRMEWKYIHYGKEGLSCTGTCLVSIPDEDVV